jgi:hypothetical protein
MRGRFAAPKGSPQRLGRGLRQKASGEVVAQFNMTLPPATKVALLGLAVRLGKDPSAILLEALFAVHPSLETAGHG